MSILCVASVDRKTVSQVIFIYKGHVRVDFWRQLGCILSFIINNHLYRAPCDTSHSLKRESNPLLLIHLTQFQQPQSPRTQKHVVTWMETWPQALKIGKSWLFGSAWQVLQWWKIPPCRSLFQYWKMTEVKWALGWLDRKINILLMNLKTKGFSGTNSWELKWMDCITLGRTVSTSCAAVNVKSGRTY